MGRSLRIMSSGGSSRLVPLATGRVTLGRSRDADLCFPDDADLSRQHLAFRQDAGDWVLHDLGSRNGTFVNGVRIREPHRLSQGDRVRAGSLTILFDAPAADAPAGPDVVFVEARRRGPHTSTVVTSLERALSDHALDAGARPGDVGVAVGRRLLQTLFAVGRELTGERPLADLFRLVLDLAIAAVGARRGVLMFLDGDHLQVGAAIGEGLRISTAVRDQVIQEKASVLVRDTALDEALKARESILASRVRALMAVPLQTAERVTGLLYVDSPFEVRGFTEDDLGLLTVLANVAAVRVEHARLAAVERRERLMARDLEQAADIQRTCLPDAPPEVPGVQLAGYNAACRTVGGDYYDFVLYEDGRVALLLGDVSGKGMPASLMMMGLQARVRLLAEAPMDLGDMMARLNRATVATCPPSRFITFFFCVLDPATGELAYANAGHNPPLVVRRSGEVGYLDGGGPVLGLLPGCRYEEYRLVLAAGDVLVLYSDGVTEATNVEDQPFGEAQLEVTLRDARHMGARNILAAITAALVSFSGGASQADDVTLVVCKRTGGDTPAPSPGGGFR